jgi:hypothetical protein
MDIIPVAFQLRYSYTGNNDYYEFTITPTGGISACPIGAIKIRDQVSTTSNGF